MDARDFDRTYHRWHDFVKDGDHSGIGIFMVLYRDSLQHAGINLREELAE